MQEKPEEGFCFFRGISPPNNLEILALGSSESGIPKTRVHNTSGEGSTGTVILNSRIISITVRIQRDAKDVIFNSIRKFKRKPFESQLSLL